MLQRQFGLEQAGTTVRKECGAGLTTFLAMAYIVAVNPGMLSETGMDFGAVFVATCLAAALGSIVMGLVANYPVALAPGMGQNAFFTYGIVLGMGFTWQTALGAVFLSGILFFLLSVLPAREWLINAIPKSLKLGICAGIGLFIGFIALRNGAVIVADEATFVSLGDLTRFEPLACLFGFVIIVALAARRISGAVLAGIAAASLAGFLTGNAQLQGVLATPPSLGPVLFELDISAALSLSMVSVVLALLLVDLFDTAGTLVGVANRAGLMTPEGRLPRLRRALVADSGATVVGALAGTSSTTSYVESAAGVEAGGRTGLTAVVVGLLFLACLFLSPLAQSIPPYATASALLFVACLMTRSLADLDWEDVTESAPAVVTALSMPLTFSIAEGIGLGFVTYAAIKLLSGRARECALAVYVVAGIFVLKFAFL